MQGCDLLRTPPFVDAVETPIILPLPREEESEPHTWHLHTPPLRYDVASLQHWVDLNA